MSWTRLTCALAVLSMIGCGPDIEDICEDFVDDCGDGNTVSDCIQRGEAIQEEAFDTGCDNDWERYIHCVDDSPSLCNVADSCSLERAILEDCGVVFAELD